MPNKSLKRTKREEYGGFRNLSYIWIFGREYCIFGECLLWWTVEGIRNDFGYGSLAPYLIDTAVIESDRFKGLRGTEILIVKDVYKDWKDKNPLEKTAYKWF